MKNLSGKEIGRSKYWCYDVWMGDVNAAVSKSAGLSVYDLPDCPYRDWYDAGLKPSAAASRAIKAAKE